MTFITGETSSRTIMLAPVRTLSIEMGTCPILSVQPTRGLVDEKFQIVVMSLLPNQEVTLHSIHQSEDKDVWEAFGHYKSDEHGTVTVAKDESLGGTYEGTEPMGLLWSMRPVPGSRSGLRLRKRDILTPMVVHISVYDGHLNQGFNQKTALATSVTERWYMAPGVQRVDIREKGVRGTLFLPPGPGPYPGVLDLWGGGGGLVEYRSALLASHGFASLALEYLTPDELKTTDVDSSYFEEAYQILQNNPKVQRNRMAMLGLSFGSAITLTMVAYSKVIKPQCCVCISGSHVVPVDKSIFKVFEEIKKNMSKIRVNKDNHVIQRDLILPIPSDPTLKIDVGRIKCPVLLVNAGDDQNWPTVESAEDMEMMMEMAGNRHLLEVLTYPDAGHLIEPPYTPHFRSTNFILQEMKEKIVMLWGGQTKPHAYAQEDAWEKILSFLQKHLYFSSNSAVKAKL
ncbi:peroxisomal succinyl-coenzyme A thioesterase-like [Xyrauchen texanus]|uniref:peroxisomal succinyl-coenzyme A thioesterase-like n=1 Tax=Xyrauchen texanus TaxID=154827 RepID=UPI0022428BE6|nr:peroxisomal succinyl-coenzyme A thioesterase-like [Xyrauchen texanus]XP_051974138.1 peroxisomal succinyl-coenzyme A thioesterase-like [Xyrauchen texanus]XP_051974139.1 peroxisomal succinyl-coenzyme A thioesterase-like [Xyrauchen texanus]XP_051974140.1 peroxisomal succinyl-coenzyme A thioesterase-like [Xyrauchen texanus]XP_051974141.1 peroxisomal succinyl-coenzyme A thioesterase-like [Xyrauchen texanus]XP_051974142.1 peroxisomal succinyl-coenzyme A thioesterase-like [Xyrauchen texanus]